eukprot:TRINITY_DN805_c2_g1_i1.p2 TRINITY_DN805_c2_g1~~TRINITY_DN805_c2_g1_i1.p2  ORF type:complete len:177 (-),score=38.12 TRINITY_DN805_c2_g1_i1:1683-2213(-)
MAVQAQYPSNILLLNPNRNGQEGKKNMIEGGDYALQSQPEEVLHHSQMFYGNGVGVNPRKRVREAMNTTADTPVNLFHLQSQPSASTLIDLAQLQNHHSPMVSTGLRLSLEDQQQQQQQQACMAAAVRSGGEDRRGHVWSRVLGEEQARFQQGKVHRHQEIQAFKGWGWRLTHRHP